MTHPLRLGFLIPGTYDEPGMDACTALDESIALFRFGEQLGYDVASHRVRHFERALTGVFPFLGAVARETSRIRLGTATVPIANESPIRLAEDAATVDLLSHGRLELGVGAGHGGRLLPRSFAAAYEQEPAPPDAPRTDHVLRRFLRALEGEQMAPLTPGEHQLQFAAPEEALRVHPRVHDLRWRISYGTGSLTSTVRAGELGLGLQLANFGRTEAGTAAPGPAGPYQVADIDRYVDAWDRSVRAAGRPARGRVTVSRVVVPYASERQRDRFAARLGDPAAIVHSGGLFGPAEEVAGQLADDPAIRRAREYGETTLLLIVPFHFGFEHTRELLAVAAERVAPLLGWVPHR